MNDRILYIVTYIGLSDNDPDGNGYCEIKAFDTHERAVDTMESMVLAECEEQRDFTPRVERGTDVAIVSWNGGSDSVIIRIHETTVIGLDISN